MLQNTGQRQTWECKGEEIFELKGSQKWWIKEADTIEATAKSIETENITPDEELHKRYGHISYQTIHQLLEGFGLAQGIQEKECMACKEGKST